MALAEAQLADHDDCKSSRTNVCAHDMLVEPICSRQDALTVEKPGAIIMLEENCSTFRRCRGTDASE